MNEYYMRVAIKEAKKAFKKNEIPVGAVIVCNNKIVSKACNKKEKKQNALMHAEIIAINKACKKKKSWRLNDCVMYVTMEPCNMCMGAIIESRIKKIYCGIYNNKSKEINKIIMANEKLEIEYGINKNDIEKIMKESFKKIRSR